MKICLICKQGRLMQTNESKVLSGEAGWRTCAACSLAEQSHGRSRSTQLPSNLFLETLGHQLLTKAFLRVSSICDSYVSANSGAACSSHVCNCAAGAALLCPDVITWYTLWLSTRKWHHHLCLPSGSSPGAAQMGMQSHERTSFICPTTREQEDP